ncbi:NADH-quinone oxidoreductase subunit L, partial [Mesorhizobium sp. M4B.F.Ca.ET.215.01.1.1]
YIVALPAIVASLGLILSQKNIEIGIWRSDVLSWLMVGFVLIIGVIIQRYCIRYLAGDKSYKKYFTLFTFTTTFASFAWLTADMRIMVISWGCTLLGLTI